MFKVIQKNSLCQIIIDIKMNELVISPVNCLLLSQGFF